MREKEYIMGIQYQPVSWVCVSGWCPFLAINIPHIIGIVFFFHPAMIISATILNLLMLWLYLWDKRVEKEIRERVLSGPSTDPEEKE